VDQEDYFYEQQHKKNSQLNTNAPLFWHFFFIESALFSFFRRLMSSDI